MYWLLSSCWLLSPQDLLARKFSLIILGKVSSQNGRCYACALFSKAAV